MVEDGCLESEADPATYVAERLATEHSFAGLLHPYAYGCRCGTEDLYIASCPGVFLSGIQPRRFLVPFTRIQSDV
ncbi:hypothetical protein EVAR_5875_1 [Eumeta japonica]|uniref:Uncharacterized protein n=1 Tax=Eumeta variegata TaxID=151549 RepID=A0A4C1TF46_EUMVA|nr:hypothetical protein EVAR_5875_1 [Eumeta japonica]